jgi:hypothetical protein
MYTLYFVAMFVIKHLNTMTIKTITKINTYGADIGCGRSRKS